MRLAFQKVCEALELDSKPGEPMTELVVTKIIEHAKAGEIDPERLCRQVLLELSSTKRCRPMNKRAKLRSISPKTRYTAAKRTLREPRSGGLRWAS
jgi:hypothetical protein